MKILGADGSALSHPAMADTVFWVIEELVGHEHIKMTMGYSHLSQQHLQEAVGLLGLRLSGEMQRQLRSPSTTEDNNSIS